MKSVNELLDDLAEQLTKINQEVMKGSKSSSRHFISTHLLRTQQLIGQIRFAHRKEYKKANVV